MPPPARVMRTNVRRLGVAVALAVAAAALATASLWGGGTRSETVRGAPEGQPYTVEMSPMGPVEFRAPPRRIVTLDANYNDLLVALDRQGGLLATGSQTNFYDGFYRQLGEAVRDVDTTALQYLYGQGGGLFDKETLYALDADVHHIDPRRLARNRGWTAAGVQEIARNVGPFFANRYSRTCDYPGDDAYEFYELWQLYETVADVYRQGALVRRLAQLAAVLTQRIEADLPPPAQRPSVGLVIYSNGQFLPFSLSRPGFGTAQYRAVGAVDAFESIRDRSYADAGRGARLDLEAMLALDPDVLIVPWAIYEPHRYAELRSLVDHPLGSRLRAVRGNRLHPGGSPLQGPIFHLFQIEMAAKQVYPERFGRYRDDQDYPPDERLFSRDELAQALRGR